MEALARLGLERIPEVSRRAVRLEGAISPVPLILHLEEVAVERELEVSVRLLLDRETVERFEQTTEYLTVEVLNADTLGERSLDDAAGCSGSIPLTSARRRMEHTEADPTIKEALLGNAVQQVRDHTRWISRDQALQNDAERGRSIRGREGNPEAGLVRVDREIR